MSNSDFSIELIGSGYYRHDGSDTDPGNDDRLSYLMDRIGNPDMSLFDAEFCERVVKEMEGCEYGDVVTIKSPINFIPSEDKIREGLELTKGGMMSFVASFEGTDTEFTIDFEDGTRNICKMMELTNGIEGIPSRLKPFIGLDANDLEDERYEDLEDLSETEIDELMHAERKTVFVNVNTGKIYQPYEERKLVKLVEPIEDGNELKVVNGKVPMARTHGSPSYPGA